MPRESHDPPGVQTHSRWLLVWLGCVAYASATLLPSGHRTSARLRGGIVRNCPSFFASCVLIGVARQAVNVHKTQRQRHRHSLTNDELPRTKPTPRTCRKTSGTLPDPATSVSVFRPGLIYSVAPGTRRHKQFPLFLSELLIKQLQIVMGQ